MSLNLLERRKGLELQELEEILEALNSGLFHKFRFPWCQAHTFIAHSDFSVNFLAFLYPLDINSSIALIGPEIGSITQIWTWLVTHRPHRVVQLHPLWALLELTYPTINTMFSTSYSIRESIWSKLSRIDLLYYLLLFLFLMDLRKNKRLIVFKCSSILRNSQHFVVKTYNNYNMYQWQFSYKDIGTYWKGISY